MLKKIFVALGIFVNIYAPSNYGAAPLTARPKPTHEELIKKMVFLTASEIKIPYLLFQEIHEKIVYLCEMFYRAKTYHKQEEAACLLMLLEAFHTNAPKTAFSENVIIAATRYGLTKSCKQSLFFIGDDNTMSDMIYHSIQLILYQQQSGYFWYNMISDLEYCKAVQISDIVNQYNQPKKESQKKKNIRIKKNAKKRIVLTKKAKNKFCHRSSEKHIRLWKKKQ
ncbi:hypothetical protein IPF37_02030 [bacterium]|nr:MAG: hypothetical protein IPF37_02030 [bacterium]